MKKVLMVLMGLAFTFVVSGCKGIGKGYHDEGGGHEGGGQGCSVGVDLHEFRHLQFYVEGAGQNDRCVRRVVKIQSYKLYREHDACFFTSKRAKEWISGVWKGHPFSTTTFSVPAGSYRFCYQRTCSGKIIHTTYASMDIGLGYEGQAPRTIQVSDNSRWKYGACLDPR